jgi:HK97 gp10 family phage protein
MSTDLSAIFSAIDAYVANLEIKADQAVQGAGIETEGLAKQACPVDTGRLRSSIKYTKTADLECTVGTNVNYAPYIEYGHKSRGSSYVPAKPFLFPAYQTAKQHMIEELKGL